MPALKTSAAFRPLVVLLIVVVVGAVGFSFLQWQRYQGASVERELSSVYAMEARAFAVATAERIVSYQSRLDQLAGTAAALEAINGRVDASAFTARAAERLPPHLALRLLAPVRLPPEDGLEPPVSFASIELMQRGLDPNAPLPLEFHGRSGMPNGGYFVMISRVRDGEEVRGFLHLSIAPGDLLPEIPALGARRYLEVRQVLDDETSFVILAEGQRSPDDDLAVRAEVPGSLLDIVVGRVPRDLSVTRRNLQFIGAVILAVLVFSLLRVRQAAARKAKPQGLSVTPVFDGAIKQIVANLNSPLAKLVTDPTVNPDLFPRNISNAADGDDRRSDEAGPEQVSDSIDAPAHPPEESPDKESAVNEPDANSAGSARKIDPSVFRTYDIRGIVGETLDANTVYLIGRALGTEAARLKQDVVVVGRDGRLSSPEFHEAMMHGLNDSGRNVIDIGLVPSPLLYFATHYLNIPTGIMITGSHNPGNYNGIKIVMAGRSLSGDEIQAIRTRIDKRDFIEGNGSQDTAEIMSDYIRRVSEEIPLSLGKSLRVIVDCGNGVPGIVAPSLLRAIGHDVEELYCEVDGNFPNHHPDPSQPDNLADLIACVQGNGADLGLAFDGDGDRLGVVDNAGNIIWPDRQMVLFARDVLSRNPGAPIIFDVKCTGRLADAIRAAGGEPVMYKTGHSLIKSKMREIGAPLAGEMSGHIFFKDRWYGFDDALYSACRLLEILVNSNKSPAEVFAELPAGVSTPELKLPMPETAHAAFMQKILEQAAFDGARITDIDGLRVDFPDSWGLIRPSNTTPCLVMRFEGDDDAALAAVQEKFRTLLLGIDPNLELPF